MAVPRVAPTIGATTGTHHQPLPALQWKNKGRCQRWLLDTSPHKPGLVRQVPTLVPDISNSEHEVTFINGKHLGRKSQRILVQDLVLQNKLNRLMGGVTKAQRSSSMSKDTSESTMCMKSGWDAGEL